MVPVGFVYDDIFLKHDPPPWHPDSKERLISIIVALKKSDLWNKLVHVKPRKASIEDIACVHTRDYIEKIRHFGEGFIDSDTYTSEGTLEAAFYAAGSVITAVDQCKEGKFSRAFCAVRPPGHHAEADCAKGFCIFNNVAVGTRYAQKLGYRKVFIIDFDAHHGNGTQHIFEDDDTVYYFSTHQYPFYPDTGKDSETGTGKGKGFTYNVQIMVGSGDKDYIYIYQVLMPYLMRTFQPDLILVCAGYDIHREDPLAGLWVSEEGIEGIVSSILSSASVPVIFILEGGYDLDSLGECVLITIKEMLKDA
jgi:acetoin utilization deacetylase AcuC-like enzyme